MSLLYDTTSFGFTADMSSAKKHSQFIRNYAVVARNKL